MRELGKSWRVERAMTDRHELAGHGSDTGSALLEILGFGDRFAARFAFLQRTRLGHEASAVAESLLICFSQD